LEDQGAVQEEEEVGLQDRVEVGSQEGRAAEAEALKEEGLGVELGVAFLAEEEPGAEQIGSEEGCSN
jgi:hypothetical protein